MFKLKINTNDNGFKIKAFSQTKDYTASLSDTNKDTALALSNIISFSQVDVIGSQIEILNQVSFVDDDQNKTTEVVIVDEQDADYCYFIIDFDDNLLDEIYSENLGSPELDESLAFNQDFKILAVI